MGGDAFLVLQVEGGLSLPEGFRCRCPMSDVRIVDANIPRVPPSGFKRWIGLLIFGDQAPFWSVSIPSSLARPLAMRSIFRSIRSCIARIALSCSLIPATLMSRV